MGWNVTRKGALLETHLAVEMPKRSRDGLQGAEKSLETGGDENRYAYMHVPMKRVPGFHQILQDVSSRPPKPPSPKGEEEVQERILREGHSEDPDDKRKPGRVGGNIRESKAKLT